MCISETAKGSHSRCRAHHQALSQTTGSAPFDRQRQREQTHKAKRAGNSAVKGESFVVPPVVPLSLLQGSFILGCWRGRYFVQYPTSATLATRMCVTRTHAKCRFLRFGSSLCLPVDGPGFLSESPEKQFLGKKTLGGTSKK